MIDFWRAIVDNETMTSLSELDAITASFKPLGVKALTEALYGEVTRVRTFVPSRHTIGEADELLRLIGAYLDGEASLEECIVQREVLDVVLTVMPITLDSNEQALNTLQWACTYIPLMPYDLEDACDLVLEYLGVFHRRWSPGIDMERVRRGQLKRLQTAQKDIALARIAPSSIRDRISGLAH